MKLENDELKMLGKFRMYIKITQQPCQHVCDESDITAHTFRTIMKDWKYIPSKKVRDKINVFMENKLKTLEQLIND